MILEEVLAKKQSLNELLESELSKVDAYLANPVLMEAFGGFTINDIRFVKRLRQAWQSKDVSGFVPGSGDSNDWTKMDGTKIFFVVRKINKWKLHPVLRLLKQIVLAGIIIVYLLALLSIGAVAAAATFYAAVKAAIGMGGRDTTLGLVGMYVGVRAMLAAAKEAAFTGADYINHLDDTAEEDYKDFSVFLAKTYGKVRLFQIIGKVLKAGVGGVINAGKGVANAFGRFSTHFRPSPRVKMGLTRLEAT